MLLRDGCGVISYISNTVLLNSHYRMTGEKLEDALSVAPQRESTLFRNRDKFDLVVMYDEESQTFGPSISPMDIAVRIIYENAFRRMLKHSPVILVGGLKAWRTAFPAEIAQEDAVTNLSIDMEHLKMSNATNGTILANGVADLSQEPWSPTMQHRSSPFGMGQIPEDSRFVRNLCLHFLNTHTG